MPSTTSVDLFSNVGSTDDGFLIWLLDSAPTDIGVADNATGGAITGTYNSEGTVTLAPFNGLDASGEWQLRITDGTAGNVGQIVSSNLRVGY